MTLSIDRTDHVAKRDGAFTNSPYCHKTTLTLFITG